MQRPQSRAVALNQNLVLRHHLFHCTSTAELCVCSIISTPKRRRLAGSRKSPGPSSVRSSRAGLHQLNQCLIPHTWFLCFFLAVCTSSPPSSSPSLPPLRAKRDQIATITGAGRAQRGGGEDEASMEEVEAADFANYFFSYAELDHQKQMLEDERYF